MINLQKKDSKIFLSHFDSCYALGPVLSRRRSGPNAIQSNSVSARSLVHYLQSTFHLPHDSVSKINRIPFDLTANGHRLVYFHHTQFASSSFMRCIAGQEPLSGSRWCIAASDLSDECAIGIDHLQSLRNWKRARQQMHNHSARSLVANSRRAKHAATHNTISELNAHCISVLIKLWCIYTQLPVCTYTDFSTANRWCLLDFYCSAPPWMSATKQSKRICEAFYDLPHSFERERRIELKFSESTSHVTETND